MLERILETEPGNGGRSLGKDDVAVEDVEDGDDGVVAAADHNAGKG